MKEGSFRTVLAVALIAILAIVTVGVYKGYFYERPTAPTAALDQYDKVSLYFQRAEYTSESVDPSVRLTGTNYDRTDAAADGVAEFLAVPKGTYTVKATLAGYYQLETTQKIESTLKEPSWTLNMNNIGTASFGDTKTADSLTANTLDQIKILNVYIGNTENYSTLKNVTLKITWVNTVDNGENFDALTCTTHSFLTEDTTLKTWSVAVGDIAAQTTVTVTLRLQIDIGAAGSVVDFKFDADDLNFATHGSYDITAITRTLTLTAA